MTGVLEQAESRKVVYMAYEVGAPAHLNSCPTKTKIVSLTEHSRDMVVRRSSTVRRMRVLGEGPMLFRKIDHSFPDYCLAATAVNARELQANQ